ncbi:hypothetical protein B0T13DRAFT_447330 [Neurospora crassa]|nr:hypothetical protein B0T13DRAFT_447330 [Neurospora crassa]
MPRRSVPRLGSGKADCRKWYVKLTTTVRGEEMNIRPGKEGLSLFSSWPPTQQALLGLTPSAERGVDVPSHEIAHAVVASASSSVNRGREMNLPKTKASAIGPSADLSAKSYSRPRNQHPDGKSVHPLFFAIHSPTCRRWQSDLLGSIVVVAQVQVTCYGSTGRFPRAKEALNLKF